MNFKTIILHNGDIPPEEKLIRKLVDRKINVLCEKYYDELVNIVNAICSGYIYILLEILANLSDSINISLHLSLNEFI